MQLENGKDNLVACVTQSGHGLDVDAMLNYVPRLSRAKTQNPIKR
jgi:hypothetical protein